MDKKAEATPTAYQVRLSLNAEKNIDEITGYIAFIKHQPINAIKVGDAFFKAIHAIEKNPFGFKECSFIPTKSKIYRQKLCMSWYIIFKVVDVQIIILGVVHSSRKASKIKALRKVK